MFCVCLVSVFVGDNFEVYHIVACLNTSFLWLINIPIVSCTAVCDPLVQWWMSHFLWVSSTFGYCEQKCYECAYTGICLSTSFISFGSVPSSGWLVHRAILHLMLSSTTICFTRASLSTFPPGTPEFQFLHILPALLILIALSWSNLSILGQLLAALYFAISSSFQHRAGPPLPFLSMVCAWACSLHSCFHWCMWWLFWVLIPIEVFCWSSSSHLGLSDCHICCPYTRQA